MDAVMEIELGRIRIRATNQADPMLLAEEGLASPMAAPGSYNMDIEPDDIEVSDTVTLLWEIG